MRRSSQPSGEEDRILAGAWRGMGEVSIGFEKGDAGLEEVEAGLKEGDEGLVECCHDGLEVDSEG